MRLNPTSVMITAQLRTDEVVALILSVAIARAARTVPFAAEAEHALAKIEQSLPHAPRLFRADRISQPEVTDHTFVPARTTWSPASAPTPEPPHTMTQPTRVTQGSSRGGSA